MKVSGEASRPGLDTAELFDQQLVLKAVALSPGAKLLDIGCGRGGWTCLFAQAVGESGQVLAFDRNPDNAATTAARVADGQPQAQVWRGDAVVLPLADASIDICWLGMVLHHLVEKGLASVALAESRRVLRASGRLVVMEFEKIDPPPGPPKPIRLDRDEARSLAEAVGFSLKRTTRIEPHVYLQVYRKVSR